MKIHLLFKIAVVTLLAPNGALFGDHNVAAVETTTSSIRHRRLKDSDSDDMERNNNFQTVPAAHVVGPTVFPKPTDIPPSNNNDSSSLSQTQTTTALAPFLKPVLGTHRPDQDAVLVFASEYALENYVLFIESLRATGFSGDIVMAIHPKDWKKPTIQDYFRSYAATADSTSSDPRVVIYAPAPQCYNMERHIVDSSKGGMRTCQFHEIYGTNDESGTVVGVPDPRPDRTVANIRYEIYWLMAIHYNPHSWLMLVDARDTVFQSNPFANVPRTDPTDAGGLLYFFGENRNATRIGTSKQNNKWIRTAYGDVIGDALASKPTICSGATLGEQVALETYLRAMVAEADETGTVLMGSDQGFHNRLYYSGKMTNAATIKSITVFDQGTGIVNNMGALRTKPLEEWGNGHIVEQNGNEYTVLNWDGTPR